MKARPIDSTNLTIWFALPALFIRVPIRSDTTIIFGDSSGLVHRQECRELTTRSTDRLQLGTRKYVCLNYLYGWTISAK